MLRTEQRHQMHSRRMGKQVCGTASLRVQACVIGDQADVFVAQRRKFRGLENVEAGLYAAWAAGLFRAGVGRLTSERG